MHARETEEANERCYGLPLLQLTTWKRWVSTATGMELSSTSSAACPSQNFQLSSIGYPGKHGGSVLSAAVAGDAQVIACMASYLLLTTILSRDPKVGAFKLAVKGDFADGTDFSAKQANPKSTWMLLRHADTTATRATGQTDIP